MLGSQMLWIFAFSAWISGALLLEETVECHRRQYTYKASQTDEAGLQCWDHITAMSCWGRCDSGEIGDWRFPFKRQFHPVCIHDERQVRYTVLQHCDPGAEDKTAQYEYYDAVTCSCLICDSATTSCQENLSYNPNVFPGTLTKRSLFELMQQRTFQRD